VAKPSKAALRQLLEADLGRLEIGPKRLGVAVSTVKQVWQQWKDGYGGNPPVEQLERDWGAQWRPDARMRQWFSRRKVIWDRLREIVDAGQTPDAAVDQLEKLRKGKSLHQLSKQLKQQRVQVMSDRCGAGSSCFFFFPSLLVPAPVPAPVFTSLSVHL
jgi:transcriptional activator of glycolytic enzymes GCR1